MSDRGSRMPARAREQGSGVSCAQHLSGRSGNRLPPPFPRSRRGLAGCLLLGGAVLAGTLIQLWDRRGLVLPVRIAEASMAPNFCGDHWLVDCPHCQTRFAVDAQSPLRDHPLTCPQCRGTLSATHAEFRRGQRVLIQRSRGPAGRPRRWEVWALRHPLDDDHWLVKRVVGLPGERVELRAGDVYVDGRILRKSLAELRPMAILVTEDRFGPDAQVAAPHGSGWRWESTPRGWRLTAAGLEFNDSRKDGCHAPDGDWLHHAAGGDPTGAWIGDDYAYNQLLSRRLNPVSDLVLQCDLSLAPGTELAFRAEANDGTWVLHWAVGQRRLELRQDGNLVARSVPARGPTTGLCRAEFGLCDRQILFGIDGQPFLSFPCPQRVARVDSHREPTRLALGAAAGPLVIHQLRVVRDVYYERPRGPRAWPLPTTLAADQYFVLGDNSPRSIDSRHRALGPMAAERLVGSVRSLGEAGRVSSRGRPLDEPAWAGGRTGPGARSPAAGRSAGERRNAGT